MVHQQMSSWRELWKALKPGGIYIIEDLLTSYSAHYGGGFRKEGTTIEYIKSAIDGFFPEHERNSPAGAFDDNDEFLLQIHAEFCWYGICAFIKKWPGTL